MTDKLRLDMLEYLGDIFLRMGEVNLPFHGKQLLLVFVIVFVINCICGQ